MPPLLVAEAVPVEGGREDSNAFLKKLIAFVGVDDELLFVIDSVAEDLLKNDLGLTVVELRLATGDSSQLEVSQVVSTLIDSTGIEGRTASELSCEWCC